MIKAGMTTHATQAPDLKQTLNQMHLTANTLAKTPPEKEALAAIGPIIANQLYMNNDPLAYCIAIRQVFLGGGFRLPSNTNTIYHTLLSSTELRTKIETILYTKLPQFFGSSFAQEVLRISAAQVPLPNN